MTKGDFWQSWDRFKENIPTLTKEEAERYFEKYLSKLAVLYDGDELAKFNDNINKQFAYLVKQTVKPVDENAPWVRFLDGREFDLVIPENFKVLPDFKVQYGKDFDRLGQFASYTQSASSLLNKVNIVFPQYFNAYLAFYLLGLRTLMGLLYPEMDDSWRNGKIIEVWNKVCNDTLAIDTFDRKHNELKHNTNEQ